MTDRNKDRFGLFVSLLLILGCGKSEIPPDDHSSQATVVEEMTVSGFDPDGEPVINSLSDGTLRIHFEAMPPFFAEDDGTENEFENFETQMQDALGVPVVRADREVFIIEQPEPDTAEKAKAWLGAYRTDRT